MRNLFKGSPLVVIALIATIVGASAAMVLIWQSQTMETDFEVIGGILTLSNPTFAGYSAGTLAVGFSDTDDFLAFDGTVGIIEDSATISVDIVYVGVDDLKLIFDASVDPALDDMVISATAYYVCYYLDDLGNPAVQVFDAVPMSFPVNRAGEEFMLTIPNEWIDNVTYSVPVENLAPVIDDANGIIICAEYDISGLSVDTFGIFPIDYQISAFYVE